MHKGIVSIQHRVLAIYLKFDTLERVKEEINVIAILCNGHLFNCTNFRLHIVIGHGLMLSLSITKWRNLLNSQLLVYEGDRLTPTDLLNLLPRGIDLDPNTWLTRHELRLAFIRRKANALNIQPVCFLKEPIHIYKILQILDMNKYRPTYTSYVACGTQKIFHRRQRSLVEISSKLERPQLGRYWYILQNPTRGTLHFLTVDQSFLDQSKIS